MTPLAEIPFTTSPYSVTMQQSSIAAYSGRSVIRGHQFGVYALNADTGAYKLIAGISQQNPGFPPAHTYYVGDCHQSYSAHAASPDIEKWVVWIGFNPMCSGNGCSPFPGEEIQVARLDGGLRWVGQINAPTVMRNGGSQNCYVEGDFAWLPEGGVYPPTTWVKVNLNTLAVVSTGNPRPTVAKQESIDGHTYDLVGSTPALHWKLVRQGGPIVLPCYYPDKPVTREAVAVIVWNAMRWIATHPGEFPPDPGTQMFADVPLTSIYASAIDALAAAGVVSGNPCP